MSEIFLYTKAARLTQRSLTLLRKAGYIPIEVADEHAVRILLPPLPTARLDLICRAALETVMDGQWTKEHFGQRVAKGLLAQGIETRRAETEGLGAKPESPVAEGDAPESKSHE